MLKWFILFTLVIGRLSTQESPRAINSTGLWSKYNLVVKPNLSLPATTAKTTTASSVIESKYATLEIPDVEDDDDDDEDEEDDDEDSTEDDEGEEVVKDEEVEAKTLQRGPDNSCTFKFYQFISNTASNRLANFLLIGIILIYTLLGALVYRIVEGSYESHLRDQILTERNRLIKGGNNTVEQIRQYFEFISEIFGNHSKVLSRGDEDLSWDYIDSIYFCGMTYTTVGYGDITPITNIGKIFTMIYAFFGIPLFLLLLSSLGRFVCKYIIIDVSLWTKICLKLCCKEVPIVEKMETIDDYDEETKDLVHQGWRVLLYFIFTFCLVFIAGAFMFMIGENLNFLPSLYFVFITLSTLGFGDIVPENRGFMLCSVVYIVIGLTMMSTGINAIMYVLNDKILQGFYKLGSKLDEMEDGDYSDEDA